MANDIEIKVKVANLTATGMTGVTQAVNRLKDRAQEATTAITELRASLAGVASLDVDLDDRTGSGIADIQARMEALRAEGPVRLEVEFVGDTAEIAAAAAAMRTLRTSASGTNTALSTLTARAVAAAAALELVKAAAQDASHALRTLRGRAAATASAMQDLRNTSFDAASSLRTLNTRANTTDGRMETLATRTHALSTNMDGLDNSLRRVGAGMAGLRGGVGSLGSSFGGAGGGANKLMLAAIALAPALVPIAAAVSPLVPALASAGAALGAFGAALLPQILAMGKLEKAHEGYQKAVAENGAASQEAAAAHNKWLKELSKAPVEVRQAAAALDVMKESYKDWNSSLSKDTLPIATKGFAVLSELFPKMTPLVRGASVELNRLMNMLAVGVQSRGFDEFMIKLADFSQRTLRAAIDGMVKFGQAMNRGIQSDGFREFLTYVRESGPLVGETLANLGRALAKLVVAAADTGGGILTIANAFARLVNAIPTELLSVLLQMAFAMKALQLVSVGLGPAFMAAAAGASNFVRAARFGGVASAIQGVTASLTAMQRASIVLGLIAAVAITINELAEKAKGAPPDVDRLTTSLKNLGRAGQFTGELKKTFGDMDGFAKSAERLRVTTESFDKAQKFTSLTPLGPLVDKLVPKFDQLVNGTNSLAAQSGKFKAFDEAFANLAKGGHVEEAAARFGDFEAVLRATGYSTAEVDAIFVKYKETLAALSADQEVAARSMGLFGEQAIAVQAKLDMQKRSADGLRLSIEALNDVNRQALGGMIGFEAAIDAAAKGAVENAGALNMVNGVLDLNGEKARTAAGLLADLADKTDQAAAAARENGSSWEVVGGIYERGRAKLLESARAMGLTKAEAAALADQILKTPDKTAYLRGDMEDLQSRLNSARSQLATVPDSRKAEIRANIADLESKIYQARSLLGGMKTDYQVRIHYIRTGYIPSGGHDFEGYAHGGVIGAAGGGPRSRMTLVGEQGPELVDLAPGSRVRSNPDSKRIAAGMAASGSGGPTVLEIRSSGSRVDDLIVEILRRSVRNNGGDVQIHLGGRRS
ncbi:hypothetical protein OG592_26965 [Streptomyces avidinii]|uniref:hypothetical protein n=1 Tax=Streptomyces avidinii TaxID=1895 RepID=UPI0038654731|nr:hypothetical protein OG592_26965 [Streptomyces avidinii]